MNTDTSYSGLEMTAAVQDALGFSRFVITAAAEAFMNVQEHSK